MRNTYIYDKFTINHNISPNVYFDFNNVIKNAEEIPSEIVFNFLQEDRYYHFDEIPSRVKNSSVFAKYVDENDIKTYIIHTTNDNYTYNDGIFPQNTHFLKWPVYDLHVMNNIINRNNIANFSPQNIKRLYTCVNGTDKEHRIYLVTRLLQKYLGGDGYLSLCTNSTPHRKNPQIFLPSELKYIVNNSQSLQNTFPIYDEFYKSLIEIVTESETEHNCFTEKTWKPLLLGKPFIIYGSSKIHDELLDMGFKSYDLLWRSDIDDSDVYERGEIITEILFDIINFDYQKIYKELFPTIIHNQKRAKEIINNNEFFPEELSFLSKEMLLPK